MKTCKLLIIYDDKSYRVVSNVSEYGFNVNGRMFYFEVDGLQSYIPAEKVQYFGKLASFSHNGGYGGEKYDCETFI